MRFSRARLTRRRCSPSGMRGSVANDASEPVDPREWFRDRPRGGGFPYCLGHLGRRAGRQPCANDASNAPAPRLPRPPLPRRRPNNRLIADSLEADRNLALRVVQTAHKEYVKANTAAVLTDKHGGRHALVTDYSARRVPASRAGAVPDRARRLRCRRSTSVARDRSSSRLVGARCGGWPARWYPRLMLGAGADPLRVRDGRGRRRCSARMKRRG